MRDFQLSNANVAIGYFKHAEFRSKLYRLLKTMSNVGKKCSLSNKRGYY